jgi:ribosomal protein S18 acetylase RimI-like enzyme
MEITKVNNSDIAEISKLHKIAWSKDHFTYYFNINFLQKYYELLIKTEEYCIVAKENNEIMGYIIGGTKSKVAIDYFVKKHWFYLLWILVIHPKFIIEKFFGLINKLFNKTINKKGKIVTIFIILVNPKFQNKGIGQKLIENFEILLLENGINEYGLSVRKNNKKGEKFYFRMGFSEYSSNNYSIFFTKTINNKA